MKPMLAFKFQDYSRLLTFPYYVQPKLNGVRALFSCGNWQSRDEKLWREPVLRHLTEELKGVCPSHWILDGELYLHGASLQTINGAVSVNRKEPTNKTYEMQYHVFDAIDSNDLSAGFEARADLLDQLKLKLLAENRKLVTVVPTTRCQEASESELLYGVYRSQGYEGLMYRSCGESYGFIENCTNKENRWRCLLKRKDWLDDEFEITGFNLTEGEKGEQGFQVWCKAKNGKEFKVGSGLSRSEVMSSSEGSLQGKLAKVKYEMLSDEGIPLKPTIEAILEE